MDIFDDYDGTFMAHEQAEFVQLPDGYMTDALTPDEESEQGITDLYSHEDELLDVASFMDYAPL